MHSLARVALLVSIVVAAATRLLAGVAIDPRLATAVAHDDYQSLRERGPAILPQLVALYRSSPDPHARAAVARAFYVLGWPSEEAKSAMLADLGTLDEELRSQVQWALGRVSNDPVVVDRLLDRMEHDAKPLFRDKAACALANDQTHLDPAARFALAERVVERLDSPDAEMRSLAINILRVLTGQAKGFIPSAPTEFRQKAVARWHAWLDDYRRSL
jgi:hypothetical protein